MAFSINKVTLVGNLTRDPDIRFTPDQNAICKLSIVTNHSVKQSNGQWEDVPSYHRVVVWGKLAEWVAREVGKGSRVYVDGSLKYGNYTDEKGIKRYTIDVNAKNVISMSKGSKKIKAVQEEPSTDFEVPDMEDISDDIPL